MLSLLSWPSLILGLACALEQAAAARELGAAGTVAVQCQLGTSLCGFDYASGEQEESAIGAAVDLFVAPRWSVGVAPRWYSVDIGEGGLHELGVDARVGRLWTLAPGLSLWPRLVAGYASGDNTGTSYDHYAAAVELPLVMQPVPHAFLSITARAELGRNETAGTAAVDYRTVTAFLELGGWF